MPYQIPHPDFKAICMLVRFWYGVESLKHLINVPHVQSGHHLVHIYLVGLLHKDLVGSCPQNLFIVLR